MTKTKTKAGRDEPQETRAEATQKKWAKIREDAGDHAGACSVFRLISGKRDEQLGNVSVDDLGDDPYELLRHRWGGGEYLVVMRDDSGEFLNASRVHYHLAGAAKSPEDAEKSKAEAKLEERLKKLAEDGGRDSPVLVELIRMQGAKPGPNMAEIITAVGTVLAPVLTAMLERPEREAPPPPPTALEQIETLGAVLSLARDMNPPADGIGALAKTLGEPIAKLVDSHLAAQGKPDAPAKPPTEAGVARPEWYEFLAPIIPQALVWAAAGKDPELRGDFIVDELTDEQLGPVYRVLSKDEFRDEFFKTFPEATEHVEWFDVLFRRIASGIVPPEELKATAELEAARPETPDAAEGEPAAAEGEPATEPTGETVAEGADAGDVAGA